MKKISTENLSRVNSYVGVAAGVVTIVLGLYQLVVLVRSAVIQMKHEPKAIEKK